MTIAVHVSYPNSFKRGSVVFSHQSKAARYKFVHPIYADECRRATGKELPYEFSYAYRRGHPKLELFPPERHNTVYARDAVAGNLNHSLYATLDKRIKDPEEIRREAKKYFANEDPDSEELISNNWRVVRPIKKKGTG